MFWASVYVHDDLTSDKHKLPVFRCPVCTLDLLLVYVFVLRLLMLAFSFKNISGCERDMVWIASTHCRPLLFGEAEFIP